MSNEVTLLALAGIVVLMLFAAFTPDKWSGWRMLDFWVPRLFMVYTIPAMLVILRSGWFGHGPSLVLASNDGPLGVMASDWLAGPIRSGPGSPIWCDSWWLGSNGGSTSIGISYVIAWLLYHPALLFWSACGFIAMFLVSRMLGLFTRDESGKMEPAMRGYPTFQFIYTLLIIWLCCSLFFLNHDFCGLIALAIYYLLSTHAGEIPPNTNVIGRWCRNQLDAVNGPPKFFDDPRLRRPNPFLANTP